MADDGQRFFQGVGVAGVADAQCPVGLRKNAVPLRQAWIVVIPGDNDDSFRFELVVQLARRGLETREDGPEKEGPIGAMNENFSARFESREERLDGGGLPLPVEGCNVVIAR